MSKTPTVHANPQINLVQPQLPAIIRIGRKEAATGTSRPKGNAPVQENTILSTPYSQLSERVKVAQIWESGNQSKETKDPANQKPTRNEREKWDIIMDNPNRTNLISGREMAWERQRPRKAYEVNGWGIRDDQAPIIQVQCKAEEQWKSVDMVTLDGGAGVNVMTKKVRKMLDLELQEAPFQLRMADQTIAKPLGMVKQVPIRVGVVEFETTFIILNIGEAYDMLMAGHGSEPQEQYMIGVLTS